MEVIRSLSDSGQNLQLFLSEENIKWNQLSFFGIIFFDWSVKVAVQRIVLYQSEQSQGNFLSLLAVSNIVPVSFVYFWEGVLYLLSIMNVWFDLLFSALCSFGKKYLLNMLLIMIHLMSISLCLSLDYFAIVGNYSD